MWADEYKGEFGEQVRVIEREGAKSKFEVVFDFCGIRRYCHVDADTLQEALGVFFMTHADVPFRDVVDFSEIAVRPDSEGGSAGGEEDL